jgi:uncharacterized membrane protein
LLGLELSEWKQFGRNDLIREQARKSQREGLMIYGIAYLACLVVMGGLDYLWLSYTSGPLYHRDLATLLAENPNMTVAVIFYLGYAAGVVFFAVRPALAAGDWRPAILNGTLLGLFAYATYDLTNFATMKVWTLRVTALDIVWGMFLTAAAAGAGAGAALKTR